MRSQLSLLHPTLTEEQRKERAKTFCQVTFNDKSLVLGGKQDELYVPPQRREGVALIWEQYFPNFLIDTKREGTHHPARPIAGQGPPSRCENRQQRRDH